MQNHFVTPRGVTTKDLTRRRDRKIATNIVNDQIRTIDAAITLADSSGFDYTTHELPINFDINNLTKCDAQLLIYSEIIRVYRDKGFQVFLSMEENKSVLSLKWKNEMDQNEKIWRTQIIKSSTIH